MCCQLLYLFITSLHYIVTYIVVHLNDNFPWYFTWVTWCLSFSSFSWNMIFGFFLAGYENYSRKTTKNRDVIFSPLFATCKFCQIRWFVMMCLHIEPLQPISRKKMCCVRRKSSNRIYLLTVFIYIRCISSKLPHLINEYSC